MLAGLCALWAHELMAQNTTSLALQKTNGQMVLSITGAPGTSQQVQYVERLEPGNSWQLLSEVYLTQPTLRVIDTNASAASRRFYRTLATEASPAPPDLGYALNASQLEWRTGGDADWIAQSNITHDGVWAGRPGSMAGKKESWVETTVNSTRYLYLTFWWRVSSMTNIDFLRFSLDGTNQFEISGETDWRQPNRTIGLPAGTHVLRWTYVKTNLAGSGQDAAWLDEVKLSSYYDTFYKAPLNSNLWDVTAVQLPESTQGVLRFELNGGSIGAVKQVTALAEGVCGIEAKFKLTNSPSGRTWTELCAQWGQINGVDCVAVIGLETDPESPAFARAIRAQVVNTINGQPWWRREIPLGDRVRYSYDGYAELKIGYDPVKQRIEFWVGNAVFGLCPLPVVPLQKGGGRFWLQGHAEPNSSAVYLVDDVQTWMTYTAYNTETRDVYVDANSGYYSDLVCSGVRTKPLRSPAEALGRAAEGTVIHILDQAFYNKEPVVMSRARDWSGLDGVKIIGENSGSSWAAAAITGSGSGTGIYVEGFTGVVLENLHISGWGQGIVLEGYPNLNATITQCDIYDQKTNGVVINGTDVLLANCYISGNQQYGVYLYGASVNNPVQVVACEFISNGTAICSETNAACFSMRNCLVHLNGAAGVPVSGVLALRPCELSHNTVVYNRGATAVVLAARSDPFSPTTRMLGNIVAGNEGVGLDVTRLYAFELGRNNLWGNDAGNIRGLESKLSSWRLYENISVDPEWEGNYGLSASSACVNAGYYNVTNLPPDALDFAGQPRLQQYRSDMGAIESTNAARSYVSPDLVFVGAGSFQMGSPTNEAARFSTEGPVTQVTISRPFSMGRYEVTQGEFMSMGIAVAHDGGYFTINPSQFIGNDRLPVDSVPLSAMFQYLEKLTALEILAGRVPEGYVYRLPTEAEWEYACRAGTSTRFSYGNDTNYTELPNFAWFATNQTHVVGQKQPNPLGLYDMYGNLSELCFDVYTPYLPGGSVVDPVHIPSSLSADHVVRGGVWDSQAYICRSAARFVASHSSLYYGSSRIGFRVVLAPEILVP
jgi:formylglycine-generating enzyme required for sulfatase activity